RLAVLSLAHGLQRRQALLGDHELVGARTKYGTDFLVSQTIPFSQDELGAVENDVQNLGLLVRGYAALGPVREKRFCGGANGQRERDRQLLLQNDLDDSQRGAAQSIGIARAGGHYAHGKTTHDGIEFVGERDRAAGQIPGDRIFKPYGAVVIVNSVGDFIGFALGTRVQTADDSLKLGKLANHFGGEVALGELRGAVGFRNVRVEHAQVEPLLGAPASEAADAFDFVAIAAEPRFVGDTFEFGQIVGQPTFLIRLPEKLCVGEARAKDALVAGADHPFGVLIDIDDGQKVRSQLAVLLFHGEILLVVAHDGDQDFVREAQKGGIEIALDDTGIFVEIGHQLSKRGVFVDAVTSPFGMGFQFRGDFLLASGGTNDHAILLESLFVVREVANVNGARAEEAVAARGAAGNDAGDREFQWSAVEYGDDPADGTNEPCTVQTGPGHGARPGKVVHSAGQNGNQDLFSG